jgi:uncharacterized protein with GYD domain
VEIAKVYVIATMKPSREHNAAKEICKTKEVTELLVSCGLYDMVVRIETKS